VQRTCDEAKQEARQERQRSEVLKARLTKLTANAMIFAPSLSAEAKQRAIDGQSAFLGSI